MADINHNPEIYVVYYFIKYLTFLIKGFLRNSKMFTYGSSNKLHHIKVYFNVIMNHITKLTVTAY